MVEIILVIILLIIADYRLSSFRRYRNWKNKLLRRS